MLRHKNQTARKSLFQIPIERGYTYRIKRHSRSQCISYERRHALPVPQLHGL
jgi:hypothetical protein